MKLIIAIIGKEHAEKVMENLSLGGFNSTKIGSSGGFLKAGNITVLVGTECEKVDIAIEIIGDVCKSRKKLMNLETLPGGAGRYDLSMPIEVDVGGATIFVVDVDKHVKL